MKLSIKVITRAKKNEIIKIGDLTYKVRVTSPPIDNQANKEIVSLLAKFFGLSKSKVKIIKGLRSKEKIIEVFGRCK